MKKRSNNYIKRVNENINEICKNKIYESEIFKNKINKSKICKSKNSFN